jgi:RNA polymerase sigma-70 factor (ECF subfamily)
MAASEIAREDADPIDADGEIAGLVRAARRQDSAAFARLYELHARVAHGVLLARVPRSDVDDLLQDAFLQAFRQLHHLREDGAFGPWLLVICRNRANDFHRRRRRSQVELSGEATSGADAEALAVLSAITALPEAYREPLVLRLVEGMTGPEIAARTGMTHGSVRVNLCRGLKLLRAQITGKDQPRE